MKDDYYRCNTKIVLRNRSSNKGYVTGMRTVSLVVAIRTLCMPTIFITGLQRPTVVPKKNDAKSITLYLR